jgi:hypothetical protein
MLVGVAQHESSLEAQVTQEFLLSPCIVELQTPVNKHY